MGLFVYVAKLPVQCWVSLYITEQLLTNRTDLVRSFNVYTMNRLLQKLVLHTGVAQAKVYLLAC